MKSKNGGEMATVLIVEDEKDLCELIASQIELIGLNAETSFSAEDAFEKITSGKKFDLVITDIRLPGMDGMEFIRKVKEERNEIPDFFVMTGFSDYQPEEINCEVGNHLYLKPGGLSDLIGDIKAYFSVL
ncbi:MAG: hypothetical protein CL678_16230 [Bdellovibrionaceae bacterium]|nr:hypothetical protein [Pseudobdellovibrionaceae bacterium]|tara:strand:+ start:372 stop:761 length:390 start_codon:yes stop_codon:yes gene_type:complete